MTSERAIPALATLADGYIAKINSAIERDDDSLADELGELYEEEVVDLTMVRRHRPAATPRPRVA